MTDKSLIEAARAFCLMDGSDEDFNQLHIQTEGVPALYRLLTAFAEQHASSVVAGREARIAELEAALEHYADEKNWHCSQEYEEGHRCSQTQWSSCDSRKYFDDDSHNIARQALNKQHSPGEE